MNRQWKGLAVSVLGAGRSGIFAAGALQELGADVLLADAQPLERLNEARREEIAAKGLNFLPGASAEQALPDNTELVITSPGLSKKSAYLQEALRRGLPVWSEIELAYHLAEAPILAVTGTNGKTTVTLLIEAMLKEAGKNALACGNISADGLKRTLTEAAWLSRSLQGRETLLVAEISSFQLEHTRLFAPHIAVLTNIMPDHLDRYENFEEYAAAKAGIFKAQKPEDYAVVNADNRAAMAIAGAGLRAHPCLFSRRECPSREGAAAWQYGEDLFFRAGGEAAKKFFSLSRMPLTLPGTHSIENVLAAACAAFAAGAEAEAIARAVANFAGVPHRMERVIETEGVLYINNSMCTNIEAAIRSLEALDRPAIAIMGGAEKGLDFSPLVPVLQKHVKQAALIGQAAGSLEAALHSGGYTRTLRAESLEAAVHAARGMAVPGDVVILCPACASFDMFTDFEARGAAFRRAAREESAT